MAEIQRGEAMSSRESSEDIRWFRQGVLINVQHRIDSDLKISTEVNVFILLGDRHHRRSPVTVGGPLQKSLSFQSVQFTANLVMQDGLKNLGAHWVSLSV